MSKYDFEVDLSQNSSTGIILSQIPQGASVLEFGCAAGRMTRYMNQVLNCQVCIVEYDQSAYETALAYAQDGLCDDIMNFRWEQRFQGKKFDAIIFADVLEHLTDPEQVLKRAAQFLKDDGHLYISIPNVTHNDVLLKAYKEHFDYTPTGLLDDTHVHFWGMENLAQLAAACGLSIQRMEGTWCPTGHTEQGAAAAAQNLLLENILRERQCGEIYQFVLTLGREETQQSVQFKPAVIQSHIYLDTGTDFNPDECVMVEAEYSAQGSYRLRHVITDTHKLCRVRFDPVEGQGCLLRKLEISQQGRAAELICPGGVKAPSGTFLFGVDPMVYAPVQPDAGPVVIEADIVLGGSLFLALMQDAYSEQYDQTEHLRRQQAVLLDEKAQLQGQINGLCEETRQLQGCIDGLNEHIKGLNEQARQLQGCIDGLNEHVKGLGEENHRLHDRVDGLCAEKAALEQNLGAYINLANQKDLYSLQLERDAAAMETLNQQLQGENAALRGELDAYMALTAYYRNLKVVRVRAFFARIVKGIIRRVKRLMRKEEHG